MNTNTPFYGSRNHHTKTEEQIVYDYWLKSVLTDSPSQLLEDFRCLFIEGRSFKEHQVYVALEKIVKTKGAERTFDYFFNRCCHILINRWQITPQLHSVIPELVGLFENLPPPRSGYYNTANALRQLVKNFTLSDHYIRLERLARVINTKQNSTSVGNLIHRYPYLYNHCLLGDDSSHEHQQTVRQIKTQTERRYEVNLSRYVTYKVRLAQMARSGSAEEAQRIIRAVKNPTLLSDQSLNRSLKHFVGNIDNGYTYKSLSRSFLTHTVHTNTFGQFKGELYEYLVQSMGTERGKSQFNKKVYDLLKNTLPECDHQKPSEFLMLRTSSQLLNYFVVENANNPEHYVFVDLISNMGVTRTVGLLLKVVLVCQKIKPYLEKRFSILFNHYESFTSDGVPWLVKSLENLQLAFSVHFGKVDLSCLRQLKLN